MVLTTASVKTCGEPCLPTWPLPIVPCTENQGSIYPFRVARNLQQNYLAMVYLSIATPGQGDGCYNSIPGAKQYSYYPLFDAKYSRTNERSCTIW